MYAPVLCDPIHSPCGVDYVSDADVLSAMLERFRQEAERAQWLIVLTPHSHVKRLAMRRASTYESAHRRALHLRARVSGEIDSPLYRALMRDRKRAAFNWKTYCLNDQILRAAVTA